MEVVTVTVIASIRSESGKILVSCGKKKAREKKNSMGTFLLGFILGGIFGAGFMCVFQFASKTERQKSVEEDIIAEVKSCGEYIKEYCQWQGRSCHGCVLYDADVKKCKVLGFPKDWGNVE